jgi:hypothetical protein
VTGHRASKGLGLAAAEKITRRRKFYLDRFSRADHHKGRVSVLSDYLKRSLDLADDPTYAAVRFQRHTLSLIDELEKAQLEALIQHSPEPDREEARSALSRLAGWLLSRALDEVLNGGTR